MRGWTDLDLGVVETILEDEHEHSSKSPSLSPTVSFPSYPLQTRIDKWSEATGQEPDVVIRVEDVCFHLHKDPLISRSGYLKRKLTQHSEITLSPPLNIKKETFSAVADFCYGSQIVITPFNVAALRVAAEWLEMTDENGGFGGNLQRKTETYFCQAVSINQEYAAVVLRSCLALLPEAEETTFLASRCIEALVLMRGTGGLIGCLDELKSLKGEEFQVIIDSMHFRFNRSHDVLYRIVDLYLEENSSKLTDDETARICGSVDCNKLSPKLLMHAIQNPRMPLRFIVQAMFIEQLNTRRTIPFAATGEEAVTLGAILYRDAAVREAAQLKVAMETTSSRIESLERDLNAMKKLLNESDNIAEARESDRSASFHFGTANKIERGEKGSAASASFHVSNRYERAGGSYTCSNRSCKENRRGDKSFGKKFMNGLKNVFRTSSDKKPKFESKVSSRADDDGDRGVTAIEDDRASHRRCRSVL